jgi:phosphate transport system substrate-binding protein
LNFNTIRRVAVPGIAAVALATSLAACGSDNSSTDGGSASGLSGSVAAGGSTAQETAQQAWRGGFNATNPDAKITYDAIGSGDGRAGFIKGTYAFVGSDSPMDTDELAQAKKTCGADPIEFPVFISPIDVAFNLPGIDKLQLDAKTIAQIFSGKITTWNDKAIAAQNKGVKLPATKIIPVHRSDSSGTTDNFTDYLHQVAPADWKTEHDSDWPTTKGEAQEGTSGVVGDVNDNEGAITYADDSAIQATKLGKVSIKVGSEYVAPSAEGAANGLAAAKPVSGTPASVLQYTLPRTTTDPSIYPLFMASNEIACPTYKDKATADIVKGFLTYMLSSEGQQVAQKNAYSALLPDAIAQKAQALVDQIS